MTPSYFAGAPLHRRLLTLVAPHKPNAKVSSSGSTAWLFGSASAVTGLFNPDHRVKLLGQRRLEVMTATLGFRTINHADGPLQQRLGQDSTQFFAQRISPVGQRRRNTRLEKLMLPAIRVRGPDVLDEHVAVPVISRRHLAPVGTHADQHDFAPKGPGQARPVVWLTWR